MNITEFAMFKKITGSGKVTPTQEKTVDITTNGTVEVIPDYGYTLSKVTANVNVESESNGLVDVDRIYPGFKGDENCIYRLTAGLYYQGDYGGGNYTKHGKTYFVDKLPEVGEPFSLDGQNIIAVYYNTSDKVFYAYITDEIAAAEGMTAGWNKVEDLGPVAGTVTNCTSMTKTDMFYLLANTTYFIYKDGKWVELGDISNAVSYTNCKVNFWDDEGNAAYIPITVSYKTYDGELKNVSKQLEGNSETEILAAQGTEMFIDREFNYWASGFDLTIRRADGGCYIMVPYLADCYITISS